MKKYMIILLLTSFCIHAGGNTNGIQTANLPNQKYTKQNDAANAQQSALEAAKAQPESAKESRNFLLSLFKCCCCGTVEK